MKTVLVVSAGAIFSLQMLLSMSPADARFHKTLTEVAGHPERSAECAQGDTKVVRKIVSHTINHAKERYQLAPPVIRVDDTPRAEKEMYEFLNWKLGSPSAVCGQYVTAGQKHFDKGYSDEAAAALVGMELPGAGRAQFRLPKKFSDELKNSIRDCTGQATTQPQSTSTQQSTTPPESTTLSQRAQARGQELTEKCKAQVSKVAETFEKKYGIPKEHVEKRLKEISGAGVKAVDRVGFDLPKKWDVENTFVEKLIADRRAETAGR